VNQQVVEIETQQREITLAHFATIRALSKLAESRDDDTGKHVDRVQEYCHALSVSLGEGRSSESGVVTELADTLWNAAPLHDIGKVAIPDSILRKPGKLNAEEMAEMRTHTTIGAETLESVRAMHPRNALVNAGIVIARSHHERWDGDGYPDGLAGRAIPLAARCVAIADVYDALRSRRVYKEPLPHDVSRDTIAEGRTTQFDPELVDAFLRCEARFNDIHTSLGA
jgi:putative two-component system response regulator